MCPSWGRKIGASGATPQRRRPRILGPRAADTTCSSTALTPELPSSRAAAARDGAVLCSTPCFCLVLCCGSLSLFVPISASRFRRTSARASRSLSGSLEQRTNQQCSPQELLGFLLKTFFSPCPFPAPQALKNMAPPIRAEVLRVLYWNPHFWPGEGGHLPPRRRQCRRHPLRAAGGKFFEVGPEGVNLGVR